MTFALWSDDLGYEEGDGYEVTVRAGYGDAESAAVELVHGWFYADPTNSAVRTVEKGVLVHVRDPREANGSNLTRFRIVGEVAMEFRATEVDADGK